VSLAILLIATQGSRMGGESNVLNWALWSAIVIVFVVWGSGAFRRKPVRSLVNDEHSEANRKRAIMCGFWVALASAAVCFALTFIKDYGPRDAIQVIVTSGVSAVLLNFGASERRALAV
jgi:hypothetical protein